MSSSTLKFVILIFWIVRLWAKHRNKQSAQQATTHSNPTSTTEEVGSRRLRHYRQTQRHKQEGYEPPVPPQDDAPILETPEEQVASWQDDWQTIMNATTYEVAHDSNVFEDLSEDFYEGVSVDSWQEMMVEATQQEATRPVTHPKSTSLRRSSLKKALIYHEILSKPKSLR